MKQALKCLVVIAMAMIAGLSANAQVTTSSIGGRITDAQGPVPGAVVTATYTPTGAKYYTVSDTDGSYRILNIIPGGPYTVAVEVLGYATSTTTDIQTVLAENYVHNVVLEEQTLTLNEVVVSADGKTSNMRTDRAGALTSVSSKEINMIPTVSRSMNDIMKLTPQASYTTNGVAIGGGNYRSSYVTVDGASFNNMFGIGSNLPAGGAPISFDALDQMAISITPFDVRHSGFTGGSIQTTTKSGTNEFHVSVYDYFTNQDLKGVKYGTEGNELTLTNSLANTTGVSVSGPIIKNKLFFFVNFEYDADVLPGVDRLARPDDNAEWGKGTQYNRPTVSFMEEVKKTLADKYSYDPGRYADYTASTPDWKLFTRVDWNINNNNRLTARFSHTANKYSSDPSSSVSGLTIANSNYKNTRSTQGRTSNNALYFESNRYYQEQNYTSVAVELNSRLFEGKGNNLFRVTYAKQYEPRSFVGDLFPTVDIFDGTTGDDANTVVLTSFGVDPFTYGNLRDVANFVATDEFSYQTGIHTLLAGLSFESNVAKNGYMQGGAGYYSFSSWDDFVAEKPASFSIMYGNNEDQHQEYPTLKSYQASLYLQDEMNVSDNFKLTAGVRFELPFYPDMSWNENKKFTELWSAEGYKTSDVPAAKLNISPRVGFNWDLTGDRKVVLRGGTGIFTGRLPLVWLVSAVGNSNVLQNNWGTTDPAKMPAFKTSPADIINAVHAANPDLVMQGDLAAPTGATILAKDLKMPQTWKSSLALDVELPGAIKASVEGIYNKDLRTVAVSKIGVDQTEGGVKLPGEPEARNGYAQAEKSKASYMIANTNGVNGYYYSITASLRKDFDFGLYASAAYTRSNGKSISEGIGDQVSSAWNTNTYAVNGSNSAELGYGSYVTPNRVVANVGYRIDEGNGFATNLALFYEGQNLGYVGTSYSYTRYSYTMNDVTGTSGANILMYIPTDSDLNAMEFADDANKAAFKSFIEGDKYLSAHRGEYSVRGCGVMPWHSSLNFKISQDLAFRAGNRIHRFQVGADVNNIGNLLNPKWGNFKYSSSEQVLKFADGKYTFTEPTWNTLAATASTWSAVLNVRYIF